ncbi:MAG: hypothetical protein HY704_05045 [Gemmatimonadetes bacterium]|nr:hypothetical protein [candidate division NC10 bacterium]MBI4538863.1 hypothetical protein [Gemmatimonadota bacterium]
MRLARTLAPAVGLFLIVMGAASCSLLPWKRRGPALRSSASAVFLTVHNRHWLDMRVYLVREGSRFSLGTVSSLQSTTREIPASVLGSGSSFQLQADPIGSVRTYTTEPLNVGLGQRVELTLENNLSLSTVSVW